MENWKVALSNYLSAIVYINVPHLEADEINGISFINDMR